MSERPATGTRPARAIRPARTRRRRRRTTPGTAPGRLLERLPEPVRARLAEAAATAVGALPVADVPVAAAPARPVHPGQAGPARRQRAARASWRRRRRSARPSSPGGTSTARASSRRRPTTRWPPPPPSLLTGDPGAAEAVAAAARRGEAGELRAERDAALSRVDKLTVELERLRGELAEARAAAREAGQEREAEYQQLRRRVSEQGARLRAALDGRAAADGPSRSCARRRRRTWSRWPRSATGSASGPRPSGAGPTDAAAEVAAARQAAREARQADEVRLGLLLDTVGGAVSGLRRELALGGGGPRPGGPRGGRPVGARRAGAVDSVPALDALLAVPSVHLVVDGYNVSKTGYPELPLADQRTRLVGQLAALAARTGVEITVVFDGAGVVAAPTRGSRGVRVLFSDPGVLADDVIRALVAAEPQGRPVVVATSDRAVVDVGAARAGRTPCRPRCCCSGWRAAEPSRRAMPRNCRCLPLASRSNSSNAGGGR